MRIFTPTTELPFAGHPTLGAAYVLASEGMVSSPATQIVSAGDFRVMVSVEERFAAVRQLPPEFGPEAGDRSAVAEAVGVSYRDLHPDLPPQVVGTGLSYLLVPLTSPTAVTQAVRNDRLLPRLLNAARVHGCYVFAITGDGEAKARMFDADPGILEDAATGSAAGPLGAYLVRRGLADPGRIVIHQGAELGRPSTLHVTVEPAPSSLQITVGGGVHIVGHGTFEVPG
jgi:trans-2,3-dihydro-3-hydroxyanthranilate isomerase